MDAIREDSPLLDKSSSIEELSIDNPGHCKDVDMNGNTPMRRRKGNCIEHPVQVEQLQGVLLDAITKSRESASTDARASGAWENAFIEHIQSLIATVKVSDTLTDCINDELLENEHNQQNTGGRFRRQSFCNGVNRSVSYKNAILGRRTSVTDRDIQGGQNGLRRKASTVGLENMNLARRNSGFANEGRRCSVTSQTSSRRSSVSTNPSPSRRSSVVTCVRRNSVVTAGRRYSVAHAPGYGHGPPQLRRRNSSQNVLDSDGNKNNCNIPRRRSSVVKPSCFNVSKISNIQRRLHRIYRQRRRKQRANVNVADVKSAMGVEDNETSDGYKSIESDSENTVDNTINDSGTESLNTSETETEANKTDENCNLELGNSLSNLELGNSLSNLELGNSLSNLELGNSLNCSTVSVYSIDSIDDLSSNYGSTVNLIDSEDGSPQGPIPNPRRKTSIQIRSWEISRQLRQRRRLKRKSGSESDLI